jgi:DNA-binding Lrp family transcriptional regulator
MVLSDKAFEVLDTLDRQPIINQRQLAQHAGISLGQVNYILKSLLGKGFVKVGNFRKSPHKVGYSSHQKESRQSPGSPSDSLPRNWKNTTAFAPGLQKSSRPSKAGTPGELPL